MYQSRLLQRLSANTSLIAHHGTILVTTRDKKAGIKLTRNQGMIQVLEMDESLSIDLVRKTLDVGEIQGDDIRDLVALLDYLPLALVQAASASRRIGQS
jgi:hypothetical protein